MKKLQEFASFCEIMLLVIMNVLVCIFSVVKPAKASAHTETNNYVTDIHFSKTEVTNRETVSVSVSFGDNHSETPIFHGGDTIEITWPDSGEAFLKGYKASIPLYNEEHMEYARADVFMNRTVITFLDAVNERNDVNGYVEFEALAYVATDTASWDKKTIAVTAGTYSSELTIVNPAKPAEEGTPASALPDFRKQADGAGWVYMEDAQEYFALLDPEDVDHTKWVLSSNENKMPLGDVTIRDTIGEGQAFDAVYCQIYSNGNAHVNYAGTWEHVSTSFMRDYPQSSIALDGQGTLTWHLDASASSETAWYFRYQCVMKDTSLISYNNVAEFSWLDEKGGYGEIKKSASFVGLWYKGGITGRLHTSENPSEPQPTDSSEEPPKEEMPEEPKNVVTPTDTVEQTDTTVPSSSQTSEVAEEAVLTEEQIPKANVPPSEKKERTKKHEKKREPEQKQNHAIPLTGDEPEFVAGYLFLILLSAVGIYVTSK
ncbi:hypothetical protein SAMN02910358_01996 [Lachnospiraceae bacterium XBB1006]|nr:hypothetical protein SAMN02910358_01996 [Lachnospiraceae bacterium XBB1006]